MGWMPVTWYVLINWNTLIQGFRIFDGLYQVDFQFEFRPKKISLKFDNFYEQIYFLKHFSCLLYLPSCLGPSNYCHMSTSVILWMDSFCTFCYWCSGLKIFSLTHSHSTLFFYSLWSSLSKILSADADVRLARRIRRDTVEKGRDIAMVLDQVSEIMFLVLINL